MFADIRNRKRWNRIILMEIFFDLDTTGFSSLLEARRLKYSFIFSQKNWWRVFKAAQSMIPSQMDSDSRPSLCHREMWLDMLISSNYTKK